LAINVNANYGWKNYSEGIYKGCNFDGNIDINHGVTLVGYGTSD